MRRAVMHGLMVAALAVVAFGLVADSSVPPAPVAEPAAVAGQEAKDLGACQPADTNTRACTPPSATSSKPEPKKRDKKSSAPAAPQPQAPPAEQPAPGRAECDRACQVELAAVTPAERPKSDPYTPEFPGDEDAIDLGDMRTEEPPEQTSPPSEPDPTTTAADPTTESEQP